MSFASGGVGADFALESFTSDQVITLRSGSAAARLGRELHVLRQAMKANMVSYSGLISACAKGQVMRRAFDVCAAMLQLSSLPESILLASSRQRQRWASKETSSAVGRRAFCWPAHGNARVAPRRNHLSSWLESIF